MKLRFEVDQAEAFRRGIDVPKSIVSIEVNPAELSQEQRNLIADRLNGIDVCRLALIRDGALPGDRHGQPNRVVAKVPTFESMMEAIEEDQRHHEPLKRECERVIKEEREKAESARREKAESARIRTERAKAFLDERYGNPTA